MKLVLRKQAQQPVTPEDIRRVEVLPNLTVLDVTPRMIFVDADKEQLTSFVERFPGWLLAPVVEYSLPDPPRQTIRRKPDEHD
jgi:hypothetical protein